MHDTPSSPLAVRTAPIGVVVELGRERRRGRLLARQRFGGIVEVNLEAKTGAVVLCHVSPSQHHQCTVVLEAVVVGEANSAQQVAAHSRTLVLRWNWAYCSTGLQEMRTEMPALLGLAVGDLARERLKILASGGALFAFHDEGLAAIRRFAQDVARGGRPRAREEEGRSAAPPEARLRGALAASRAHHRVRIDVPCRYLADGAVREGRVYNIGRIGFFVTTDDELPSIGTPIRITIGVKQGGRVSHVEIEGTVRWRRTGRPARGLVGFGVRILHIEDGASRRRFDALLDHLMARRQAGNGAGRVPGAGLVVADSQPAYEPPVPGAASCATVAHGGPI